MHCEVVLRLMDLFTTIAHTVLVCEVTIDGIVLAWCHSSCVAVWQALGVACLLFYDRPC